MKRALFVIAFAVVVCFGAVFLARLDREKPKRLPKSHSAIVYELRRSEPCLGAIANGSNGLVTKRGDLDAFAQTAGAGAVAVMLKTKNSADVMFERSESDARNHAALRRVAMRAHGGDPAGRVIRLANVVIAFKLGPTKEESAVVIRCLNSSKPASKATAAAIRAAIKASKDMCWNGCPGLQVPANRIMIAASDPSFAYADAGAFGWPGAKTREWVGVILRLNRRGWREITLGSSEIGCGDVPGHVLTDLGLSCPGINQAASKAHAVSTSERVRLLQATERSFAGLGITPTRFERVRIAKIGDRFVDGRYASARAWGKDPDGNRYGPVDVLFTREPAASGDWKVTGYSSGGCSWQGDDWSEAATSHLTEKIEIDLLGSKGVDDYIGSGCGGSIAVVKVAQRPYQKVTITLLVIYPVGKLLTWGYEIRDQADNLVFTTETGKGGTGGFFIRQPYRLTKLTTSWSKLGLDGIPAPVGRRYTITPFFWRYREDESGYGPIEHVLPIHSSTTCRFTLVRAATRSDSCYL